MAFHDISGEYKNPILQVVFKKKTTQVAYSNASAQDYIVLNSDSVTVTSGTKLLVIANYHWWMQDDDNQNSFHGRQYLQYEIGGNNVWGDVRAAGTATFENSNESGTYLNNRGEVSTLQALLTHGQSTGETIKFRIVHRSVQPSPVDSLVFQRNSNETNMTIMEIGA
jgi:hypothetical protein|tara:strand:+ start:616 stop:1116 length:501 start_codon:yes stop_codon:yes gene_type:complete